LEEHLSVEVMEESLLELELVELFLEQELEGSLQLFLE